MKRKRSASLGLRPGFAVTFICFALALLVALVGVVRSQSNKKVRSSSLENWPANVGKLAFYSGKLTWFGPIKIEGLRNYRVRWAVAGVNKGCERAGFRSYRKANTKRHGNAFVEPQRPDFVKARGEILYTTQGRDSFTMPGVKVKRGETLCIQVRARYNGERNGPWAELRISHPGG